MGIRVRCRTPCALINYGGDGTACRRIADILEQN